MSIGVGQACRALAVTLSLGLALLACQPVEPQVCARRGQTPEARAESGHDRA